MREKWDSIYLLFLKIYHDMMKIFYKVRIWITINTPQVQNNKSFIIRCKASHSLVQGHLFVLHDLSKVKS